jgi:phosphohistidine phosphatase
MNLLVLRHADADTPAARDEERALSEKGMLQARRVGRFCREHALVPELILSSPIRRARETAELFAVEAAVPKKIELAPFLACGMQPATALAALASWINVPSLLLVGHEPDLGLLIGDLLGTSRPGRVHVRTASLTVLALDKLASGAARLELFVPCRLMA